MKSCRTCRFFHRHQVSSVKGTGAPIYWNYCRHPIMLAQGEKGYVTGTSGKPMGASDETPDWCPLRPTALVVTNEEGDEAVLYDFEARLTVLSRRIEKVMSDDDSDDDERGSGNALE